LYVFAVEAYTASWIEIPPCNNPRNSVQSRLIQPRGLKYFSVVLFVQSPDVEAYTASWIEISKTMRKMMSVFGRGLYSLVDWNPLVLTDMLRKFVEAYTASWIEIPACGNRTRSK